jgi:glycosyltransferase involved in cell wall biosynthesis
MHNKKKICIIVSSPMTIKAFLINHIKKLSEIYHVTIIFNASNGNYEYFENSNVDYVDIEISRNVSLVKDVIALIKLIGVYRKEKFQLIHSVTPKAGMLAMIAGVAARIPIRVHIFTGQVWANRNGLIRAILKSIDKLISFCATHVLSDSHSQMHFLIKEKVVSPKKIAVLANGSISGVDTKKFMADMRSRKNKREEYFFDDGDIIFLFISRLKRDKGAMDLCAAFKEEFEKVENARLFLIGPDEENLFSLIKELNIESKKLHVVPYTDEPEKYMVAADVLCLPSYREGFGSVIIEAAACGLPAIGSRIYGVTDAIIENETGLLFSPGNVKELGTRMKEFYLSAELRNTMGEKARKRVEKNFSANDVTAAWLDYYEAIL